MDDVALLNAALAGRYEIAHEIGAGGMATVYLARDTRHDRRVALKVLKPELGAVLGVERFLAEIRVTANLQHPNLLPLFDSGEADGLLFYVMPYVEGESLRARLDREKQLPIEDALRLAIGIASALDYAHRHGVIHRDLKPENILLHEGQALVADFGIALAVSNAGGHRITQTGLSLGTPQYMSPEQATGDRVIDARSDIYSLGAVSYEMLTGEPPHLGSTAQAIIARVLTERPRSVRQNRPTVAAHVDAAVDRALAKLPADRFATARAFIDAIEHPEASAAEASAPRAHGGADDARTGALSVARNAAWLAAVAIAIGAAVIGWTKALRVERPATLRFALGLVPTDAAWQMARGNPLAVSPDGRMIAYVGGSGPGQRIFLRSLNNTHGTAIAGTDDAADPVFSPDGRWIAFIAGGSLKKVSVDGGPVATIAEAGRATSGLDWSANDVLAVSDNGCISVVPAAGGPLLRLDTATSQRQVLKRWPRFSPDGRWLLETSVALTGPEARVVARSTRGWKPAPLNVPGVAALGFVDNRLIYATAAGELMAVPFDATRGDTSGPPVALGDSVVRGPGALVKAALGRSGSLAFMTGANNREVVALNLSTGTTRVLVPQPLPYNYPRLAPDGRRIALTIESAGETQVSIYDFDSGTLSRLSPPGAAAARPEWMPDGSRVAFRSDADGGPTFVTQAANGSGSSTRIVPAGTRDLDNIWEGVYSPDGHTVAIRTGTLGASILWLKRTDDASPARQITETRLGAWAPRFSPDGRWLAYSADNGDGRHVYIQRVDGSGGRMQISNERGSDVPLWSTDGHRLFYVVNGEHIVEATLAAGDSPRVIGRRTAAEGQFYFATGHPSYDVIPKGNELLLLRPVASNGEAIVAYNWAEEVRKQLAAGRQTAR